jgi:uncharacterized membrane protein
MVVATFEAAMAHRSHRIELAPNCALTPRAARTFVGSVALLTLGVAAFFALQGLWPILAYAGLEVALLGWAVGASLRRGRSRELILISDEDVVIEHRELKQTYRSVFARHWATVTLHDPHYAQHPSRLTIESHGRACEVGRFLTEDERRGLAASLRRLVGKPSESPALAPEAT